MSFLSKLFGGPSVASKIKVLPISEFKAGISQKGITLIDVRTASEFKSGALQMPKTSIFLIGRLCRRLFQS